MLLKPTSKNNNIDINVVYKILKQVINCAPLTPIFLPKKPDIIEPSKGKIKILKYIKKKLYKSMTATFQVTLKYN
jgi:hypothetical protein